MGNLNLKTITFPELDNTYEIAVQPDGNYDNLTSGTALAILSDSYTEDSVPYKFRRVPYKSKRMLDEIVGGTVAWNQLCNGASVSVPNGHKYLSKIADAWTIGASTGAAITGLTAGADMVINLTQMLGSTIADYILALETATTGAGVSLFRSLFPADYYAYNAGELVSISGLSEHKTTGKNLFDASQLIDQSTWNVITLNVVPNTPYTMSTTRHANDLYCYFNNTGTAGGGSANVVSSSHPVTVTSTADGHVYVAQRRAAGTDTYANYDWQVEFGTTATDYEPYTVHTYPLDSTLTLRGIPKLDSNNRLYFDGDRYASDGTVTRRYGTREYQSGDESLTDTITDGTTTVYKLTTATTETADPYINPQYCSANGTEEYISETVVPVGHESRYYRDLDAVIPEAPTDDGTYVLKCTVSSGVATYSWVTA